MEAEFEINCYNIKAGVLTCMGLGGAGTFYVGMCEPQIHRVGGLSWEQAESPRPSFMP